ncbi:unnamed protein product [Nezara viridula]|uniref:Uncharacterized protein n=1 Tax=Nezara viridula TaxID=85310 RepID=A0A9P0DZR7_NEZVI|nr:unnamed protein product [Nezara viridula]
MKNRNFFTIWSRNKVYEIQKKNIKKSSGKLKTVLKMFHYTNKKDAALLVMSSSAAVVNGIIPILYSWILISAILDLFIKIETEGNPYNISMAEMNSQITSIAYHFFEIGAINFVSGFIQIWASEKASRSIMTKIRTDYLSKMLFIDIKWYDESNEQFISIVSHDLQKMMFLLDSKMASFIEILSYFLFGCLASFIVSWEVTILIHILIMATMVVVYFLIQLAKKKGIIRQEVSEKCTKIASEVLTNTRTVVAYGGEYKEIERYKNTLNLAYKHGLKQATVVSLMKASNYLILCVSYMLIYYLSVRLFLIDDFMPGYIVLLSTQIMIILQSTFMLSTVSDLFVATDSAYKVMQFLETKTSYSESLEKGVIPNTFEGNVSFRNVHFSYPTNIHTKVLNDFTLDIESGKITGVVGTSGAGKSTIVSLATRLYDISGGKILVEGVDINELNINWLRDQIGVVGQEPVLFDTSIEENIRYGKTTATLEEVIEAAKVSHAHDFIEKLPSGYDTVVGEGGTKLSGGQKQRIAIARAIVRKPKLLLLDEATSALDSHSEGIVQKALDNAMHGRTTLIIAHRMSTVRKADVIYAMKNGCIEEKGSHSELMKLKGYYYSLVKAEEQEDKEKAFNQVCAFQEDLINEDASFADGDNVQVPEIVGKPFTMNKKNLKIILILLLAIFSTAAIALFITAFYFVLSIFCESFTLAKDELKWIVLNNVGIMMALGVLAFISAALSNMMSTKVTQLWLENLQNKAFNKIVSMDIGWFDRSGNSPNECLEVLTNCPPLIESVTGDRGAQVLSFILSVLFAYGYSFAITVSVTLINLPLLIIFLIINSLRIKSKLGDTKSAALAIRSTKVATEYVKNAKTIQLLNCQNYVINQYQDLLMLSNKEAHVSIIWFSAVYGTNKALIRLSLFLTLTFGAKLIENHEVTGILFLSVLNSLCFASMTAEPAFVLMSQYPQAREALMRFYRIATLKTNTNKLRDQGDKPEISGNIVFKDVMFSYPTRTEVPVLKNLNLGIEAGTTVALVGDSGCGKSTLISLLERFYRPNSGKILIDGNDINSINTRYLRSQMGLVSQEPALFDMTIKENILYGLEEEVGMDKVIEAAKIANIHNFIMKLPQAYDTSVGERGSNLSGGQKQRIAIARAVLRDPKILLLDEFTSALDTESEKTVQEALEKASVGKTTILIAHRLSTVRKADKIVVLHSGVVVEEGTHQQLMEKKGYYFNLLNR